MKNIFDDEDLIFVVLVNEREQFSLWPNHLDVPVGWSKNFGPSSRDECLKYIEENWNVFKRKSS